MRSTAKVSRWSIMTEPELVVKPALEFLTEIDDVSKIKTVDIAIKTAETAT